MLECVVSFLLASQELVALWTNDTTVRMDDPNLGIHEKLLEKKMTKLP